MCAAEQNCSVDNVTLGPLSQTGLSYDKGCKKRGDFVSVKLLIQIFVGVISTLIKISSQGSGQQKEAKVWGPVCKSDINLSPDRVETFLFEYFLAH